MKTNRLIACHDNRNDGFTLTDLLAVIVTIGILGLLLLPALAGTKPNSQAFQCLENQRQLIRAWQMYSTDFNDLIALTGGEGDTANSLVAPNINNGNWCHGSMDLNSTAATDPRLIQRGSLFPYSKSVTLYKCPADTKTQLIGTTRTPTSRSVSMNCWMNPINAWSTTTGRIFRKQSDIYSPPPANCWVIIDVSPGSINSAWFVCDQFDNPTTWVDIPAAYHNGACGISFADGHAQFKRWTDKAVLNYGVPNGPVGTGVPSLQAPGFADLKWLQAATTSHK